MTLNIIKIIVSRLHLVNNMIYDNLRENFLRFILSNTSVED